MVSVLNGLLAIVAVVGAFSSWELMPGRHHRIGLALTAAPVVAGLFYGLLNRHDLALLPLDVLYGSVGSFVAAAIGTLRGDKHHDTGLHRLRLMDVVVLLAYAVLAVVMHANFGEAMRGHRGGPLPFIEPACLAAMALALVCFILSCDAFDTGRTRACVGWATGLLPLGCLLMSLLPEGDSSQPSFVPVGLSLGAMAAIFTLLIGLIPPPRTGSSNLHNLRRAHVLAFFSYLGIIALSVLYLIIWRQLTR
ncbi:hypothetical protein [Actinomyces qiguomingii]|uniref:hypothetical protein n=1 Tax=Actinomyces qiguomingii TaxID=2057800 RepID=UPI000FFEF0E4|nr:hypothetical protein [Actinomyces qiguomingii]